MIKFIAFILYFSFFLTNASLAGVNKNSLHFTQEIECSLLTSDSTFVVYNSTTVSAGSIIIEIADYSYTSINVTGNGTFSSPISDNSIGCVINGQTLGYAIPKWITINEHIKVLATWTANVVVINDVEQY